MCLDEEYREQWYSIAETERHALEQLDIPHFSVSLSQRALYSGTKKIISAWFPCSPLSAVKRRIQKLSTEDCRHQLRMIDLSFAQRDPIDKPRQHEKTNTKLSPTPEAKIIDVASQIAQQIQANSYRTRRGSLDWATLGFLPQPGLYKIESCGKGLYRGHSGIGLFFATLFAVSGDPQHADYACSILYRCDNQHSKDDPFDIGDGVAGTAYALYSAGRLMNNATLRTKAYKLLTGLHSQQITAAEHIDFMAGGAGVLLVAELLSREFQTPTLERLMQDIAEELLRRQISVEHGAAAWKTLEDQCLPGFAHGSSGIAYALARAGARLAASRYLEAARKGFKNEANLFDESISNWRDLRAASRNTPLSLSWCHGATGIGLAALAAEPLLRMDSRHTMARALAVVERELNDATPSLDCLCCGATGSLELLLRSRESDQHKQISLGLSSDLTARTHYNYLPRNASAPFLPGLFLGAAGVGYQLLRSTFPDKVPALLLLE
jgi:type 2 lantibiotic biosynthesis protein LanM